MEVTNSNKKPRERGDDFRSEGLVRPSWGHAERSFVFFREVMFTHRDRKGSVHTLGSRSANSHLSGLRCPES